MTKFQDVLLRLYPAEYRALFGEEIREVLHQASEDSRRRGVAASVAFGVREIAGLIVGLGSEWMAKFTTFNSYMSRCQRAGRRLPADSRSSELIELEERIQVLCRQMDHAIAHHDFESARRYAREDRKERTRLEQLRAGHSEQVT